MIEFRRIDRHFPEVVLERECLEVLGYLIWKCVPKEMKSSPARLGVLVAMGESDEMEVGDGRWALGEWRWMSYGTVMTSYGMKDMKSYECEFVRDEDFILTLCRC